MRSTFAKISGFTLVELLVTLAIAGIVLTIGIPSFVETINSNRLTSYANDLVTALNLARSEAIKRGMQVAVRRDDRKNAGTNKNWDPGWIVFIDADNDGVLDNTDADGDGVPDDLLREYPALTNGVTLRTGNNYACWVAYDSVGLSKGSGTSCNGGLSNDTFRLCDNSADENYGKSITVSPTGRARTSETTASCP